MKQPNNDDNGRSISTVSMIRTNLFLLMTMLIQSSLFVITIIGILPSSTEGFIHNNNHQQQPLRQLLNGLGHSHSYSHSHSHSSTKIAFGRTAATTIIPQISSSLYSSTTASSSNFGGLDNNSNNMPSPPPPAGVAKSRPEEVSTASEWHRQRRKLMLEKYGDQIRPLETDATSQTMGLPLLALTCFSLLGLSILAGTQDLSIVSVIVLAYFPGSMFSLWQLQLLHDVLHGSMLDKRSQTIEVFGRQVPKKQVQDKLLFWGSLPCFYGYYLYLKAGHLTHHSNLGEHSLADVFLSDKPTFEDGDVLFVAHRMDLTGDYAPQIPLPSFFNKSDDNDVDDDDDDDKSKKNVLKMSISKSGFYFWKDGSPIANAIIFAVSFMYERFLLTINDVIVAVIGKNLFFWDKPQSFHDECTEYARGATIVRGLLWLTCGWKSLLFLFLSESVWSLPPHPSCAMFVTNHGSEMTGDGGNDEGRCTPSRSTYAGAWYSIFTLGTNLHVEHHDFPTIPFQKLHELRKIAPEFYRNGSDDDNLLQIMEGAFAHPQFYACMDSSPTNFADSIVRRQPDDQPELQ
eukprot:CAMPEP_0113445410 /NCGR_PEP_ID=MMETSP0014_2-20120614/3172_1 /TAXON_ID=2857 /ORGANISM="Nitzschia sp." /LENGTH=570 /DNA_ID=CAMNT_0000336461 /DNA_START=219 /DNA_END=1931 /DNA_ORIENTATION=- /assembly_acc=CAM_ASM_000159